MRRRDFLKSLPFVAASAKASIVTSKSPTNYLHYGFAGMKSLINGASAVTFSAWINPTSLTTGVIHNFIFIIHIDAGSSGFGARIIGSPSLLNIFGRSVVSDLLQTRSSTTAIAVGEWRHVGGIIDFAGDVIKPVIGGAVQNSAAATFANASYTPGTPTWVDSIGVTSTVNNDTLFDGRIAELAIWNTEISAGNLAALGDGFSPSTISQRPVFHMPGVATTQDVRRSLMPTVVGSVLKGTHPRIYK